MASDPPARTSPPKPARDPRHRRLDREEIIEMLALEGWAVDLKAGRIAAARDGAARALDIAMAAGAGFAEPSPGRRLYDPVEIQDVLSWTVASGFDGYWKTRKAASNAAFAAETRGFAAAVGAGSAAPQARFRLFLGRTFDLRGFETGAAVRLRMPLPLRCAYHPRVDVAPRIGPDLAASVTVSDGRLEARLAVPPGPLVTIGADVELIAGLPAPTTGAGELNESEREIYLRPAEGLIQVSPRVREAADRLAAGLDPVAAVAAFGAFLIEAFEFRTMRYEELEGESACDWALCTRAATTAWSARPC